VNRLKPTRVRWLAREVRPYLGSVATRKELAAACGIRHLQQLNRSFPRKGPSCRNVRLTAKIALSVYRWREERPDRSRGVFVPTWAILRLMGRTLVESNSMFAAVANRVGGDVPRDQIYSYFYQRRRKPNGEFALRLLDFFTLLRSLDHHPKFGPEMREHPEWRHVEAALEIEKDAGILRMKHIGKPLHRRLQRIRFRTSTPPSAILKQLAKRR
jgi:hypothetical protein